MDISDLPTIKSKLPPSLAGGTAGGIAAIVLVLIIVLLPAWIWFFWRIEPGSGEIAILIRKTGMPLPSGDILAPDDSHQGIQLDVLPEGRYFRNPYTWGWTIRSMTDIPAGKLGVQTRLFGSNLPPGRIMATEGTKGIVADVLRPGKYRINPYAYRVELFDATNIRPGHAGVVTSLTGDDIFNNKQLPEDIRNSFIADEGLKGVRAAFLDAGTYYLNPYMVNVVEVNLQSQRFEMSGEDAISFLTLDGFTVNVEGTIEYAIEPESAALLTHRVGDMEDILKKVILPRARGFSRIEGSKSPAKNYIMGQTRQQFQDNLETHLIKNCSSWGVDIRSVLIRNITPPDQISSIIRDREIAVQDARKIEQQIEQAKSKAELTRQESLALQNRAKVEAETARIRAVIRAEQEQSVRLTDAQRELEVARLETRAATAQAEALLLEAAAEQKVIQLDNEAQAAVLQQQVAAFGDGINMARYSFYQKIAPRIATILGTDQPDGLGGLLSPFTTPRTKEQVQ
jgi:regulator of protease activity HflC (stomatin/prohibitin superfamily)